jgi:hypothetical protein
MLRPAAALTALAASALLALAPAASAKIVELGATGTDATSPPACPGDPCVAVSKTTGYQVEVGSNTDLYTVPEAGRIVAWTVTLAAPSRSQVDFFEKNYGGEAQARIAVLRTGSKLRARTVKLSSPHTLTPYFGKTVQFALAHTLRVHKGEVIALTVPTWAPALAIEGLGTDTAWRASRESACNEPTTAAMQTAQALNQLTQYGCLYKTARLTYTATLVTDPTNDLDLGATTEQPKKKQKNGAKKQKQRAHRSARR